MKLEIVLLALFTAIQAGQWDTYPEVPKTASINGFADPIYDELPKCARDCVKASTGNTPCPYWDTGCFCVMPQWAGQVAECFVSKCEGKEVASATSLAVSLCSSVGANQWLMPASLSTALSSAVGKNEKDSSSTRSSNADLTSDSGSSSPTSTSSSSSGSSSSASSSSSSTGNDAVMMASYDLPSVAFFMFIISLVL